MRVSLKWPGVQGETQTERGLSQEAPSWQVELSVQESLPRGTGGCSGLQRCGFYTEPQGKVRPFPWFLPFLAHCPLAVSCLSSPHRVTALLPQQLVQSRVPRILGVTSGTSQLPAAMCLAGPELRSFRLRH